MSKSGWMEPQKLSVQLEDDAHVYLSQMISVFFESIRGIYYHRALSKYINEQDRK